MKTISSLFLILFSLAAFTTKYTGTGTWQSNQGTSGQYGVVVDIEKSDAGVSINETFDFDGYLMDLSFFIQPVDQYFYNILDDEGNTVGEGYSFTCDQTGDSIHHSTINVDSFVIEATIKRSADAVYRIGSKTDNATGERIIWKDMLVAEKVAE